MSALPTCPRCRTPLTEDQPKSRCDRCRAEHHSGCWANYDACAVCSGDQAGAPAAPDSSAEAAQPAPPQPAESDSSAGAAQAAPPPPAESDSSAVQGAPPQTAEPDAAAKARRGTILGGIGFALSLLTALSAVALQEQGKWVIALLLLIVSQPFIIASVVLCVLGVKGKSKLGIAGLVVCAIYELSLVWVVTHVKPL